MQAPRRSAFPGTDGWHANGLPKNDDVRNVPPSRVRAKALPPNERRAMMLHPTQSNETRKTRYTKYQKAVTTRHL